MNTNAVLLQINGALNALKAIQASAKQLPLRQQNKIAGLDNVGAVIMGLENARAALAGETMPAAEPVALDADLLGIIDR